MDYLLRPICASLYVNLSEDHPVTPLCSQTRPMIHDAEGPEKSLSAVNPDNYLCFSQCPDNYVCFSQCVIMTFVFSSGPQLLGSLLALHGLLGCTLRPARGCGYIRRGRRPGHLDQTHVIRRNVITSYPLRLSVQGPSTVDRVPGFNVLKQFLEGGGLGRSGRRTCGFVVGPESYTLDAISRPLFPCFSAHLRSWAPTAPKPSSCLLFPLCFFALPFPLPLFAA